MVVLFPFFILIWSQWSFSFITIPTKSAVSFNLFHMFKLGMSEYERPGLVIGTRASPLALAQAFDTKRRLEEAFPELLSLGGIVIRKIMTKVMYLTARIS